VNSRSVGPGDPIALPQGFPIHRFAIRPNGLAFARAQDKRFPFDSKTRAAPCAESFDARRGNSAPRVVFFRRAAEMQQVAGENQRDFGMSCSLRLGDQDKGTATKDGLNAGRAACRLRSPISRHFAA